MNSVQDKINDINQVYSSLESKKKELVESTATIKQEMGNAFQEIRLKLQKKEKEIMDKTDIFLQEHLQELNTYSRILQSKIITLNKTLDTINSNIIRKDEINLINFYSDNFNKIIHCSEAEIPEIPDLGVIHNMKVTINQTSFETMINNLNGLFLEITSLKGYDMNKLSNPYKYSIRRDLYGSNIPQNNLNNSFSSVNNKQARIVRSNTSNNAGVNNTNDFIKNNLVCFFYFFLFL